MANAADAARNWASVSATGAELASTVGARSRSPSFEVHHTPIHAWP
jgi:hypothetical protein